MAGLEFDPQNLWWQRLWEEGRHIITGEAAEFKSRVKNVWRIQRSQKEEEPGRRQEEMREKRRGKDGEGRFL